MALENQVLYEFDSFRLNPADHSLLCGSKPIQLTPKSFEILLTLVERNGRLVTKDELMKKIWPDSFVEEANLTVNVSALRKALGDTSGQQQYIETVPTLGYRFISPVVEVRNESGSGAVSPRSSAEAPREKSIADSGSAISPTASASRPGRVRIALLAILAAVVALAGLFYWTHRTKPVPPAAAVVPRRLAILPFRNIKQDPSNDFLGYSLADAVITKLGYIRSLRVRPSYGIEKYRNQAVDIPKVAADLNVDTLLTGGFIREGNDLRITCQLFDVKTQNILWKGSFDLQANKILTVQDQVAEQIIQGLELNLSSSEEQRLKLDEPASPLAYEYYLRGVDLYSRSEFPLAIQMLEKSAEIDPSYALTWAYLGRSYNAGASFQFGGREYYRKAKLAFERAIALQPAQIETRVYSANFLTDTGKVEEAVPLLREALKTNPDHAELHWELGYAYRFAGMLNESAAECELARRLDPGVKINSSALNAYLYLGRYDEFLESLPKDSEVAFLHFYRGLAGYYEKRYDEAAVEFDRAFELNPSLLQAQIGKALSHAIHHRPARGLSLLRDAETRIEHRGVGDSEAIYKLAQSYALLGDRPSALRVLRRSIESGFFPYPYFTADPLLDNLRRQPEFATLMKTAKDRHEAFKNQFFSK
jgi:DNA-binding winged helix-turn-helix (wHTH) protein/TolB-like protein